jgi:hypothetical protein
VENITVSHQVSGAYSKNYLEIWMRHTSICYIEVDDRPGEARSRSSCIAAVRPLRIEEFVKVLSACSSLVIIIKHGDSLVLELMQFSVKRVPDVDSQCRIEPRYLVLSHPSEACLYDPCTGFLGCPAQIARATSASRKNINNDLLPN